MSVNKVILIGRLGADPELKYTPAGMAVCGFTMATSESWTDKSGQKQEKTEWHRIVVWGKLAELCNQYLSKGRQAYVEGSLQTRSWEQDGQKKYTTEIVAKTIQFLGGQPTNQGQSQGQGQGQGQGQPYQGQNQNHAGNYNPAPDASYDDMGSSAFTADDIPF